ncbi:MAG: DUF2851 family protein, partial [Chloroflexi bacterium]|nr:DUF2851 family protein [Chloroflexota bacterium]
MTLATAAIRENSNQRSYEVSERALAVLWQRAHSLPDGLITEDGRRLRVLYPGRANARAGPDFRDAVLSTEDGRLLTGDVELHVNAPDWYAHKHHSDGNYDGVILHVVLRARGSVTASQRSGLLAPVVSLGPVAPSLDEKADSPPAEALSRLQSLDETSLLALLDRAGDERFLAKSRGFAIELASGDAEQTLYRAVMEALGYASNRKPFRTLADRVPVESLARLKREPQSARLLAMKAMLLAGSGLLTHVKPAEEAELLKRVLRRLPSVRAMSAGEWRLFRVRPSNHPIARIYGAAMLVERYVDTGLVAGIEELALNGDAPSLARGLMAPPFIGKGRAGDIAVNVALPFLRAFAEARRSGELRQRALEMYREFPRLQDNELTREARRLLAWLEPAAVSTARRQQGL